MGSVTRDYTLRVYFKFYNTEYFAGSFIGTASNGWQVSFDSIESAKGVEQHSGLSSSGNIRLKEPLRINRWYMLEYSRDSDKCRCFINGQLQGDAPSGGNNVSITEGATIGQWWYRYNNGRDYTHIYLSKLEMYDGVLNTTSYPYNGPSYDIKDSIRLY